MRKGLFVLMLLLLAGCDQKDREEEGDEVNGFHRMAELDAQKSDRVTR